MCNIASERMMAAAERKDLHMLCYVFSNFDNLCISAWLCVVCLPLQLHLLLPLH